MRSLITGAAGQDGTLLARLLRDRGDVVLGVDRISDPSRGIIAVDLRDDRALERAVRDAEPDRIFHLAACHHSADEGDTIGSEREMLATNFRSTGVLATTIAQHLPRCRLLYAGSSQMYSGGDGPLVVDENTPMRPGTFYGLTKAWSRELLAYHRQHHGVYCGTVILFNHESTLRSPNFVTRKITLCAAQARVTGSADLKLRDLEAECDWSSAEDVVAGMVTAISAAEPRDYVVASGTLHRVRDVLDVAFGAVDLSWRDYLATPGAVRPDAERSRALVGDASRLRDAGWEPKVGFADMIRSMVEADVAALSAGNN